jgi:hypothetical protein
MSTGTGGERGGVSTTSTGASGSNKENNKNSGNTNSKRFTGANDSLKGKVFEMNFQRHGSSIL